MKPDLHQMMRVGIVAFMAFPELSSGDGPVLEAIEEICHDPFFESIEVTRINDGAVRKKVAEILAASQMEVGFACQPIQLSGGLDLNSPDEGERKKAVETLIGYLPMAKELGATKFALLSGRDPGPEGRDAAIERLVDSLAQVCEAARGYDLAVALEVFDREIDKKAVIGSTKDAVRVAARLRPQFPDFGLMLDLSHLPLQGESSREALTLAKDYITHIHVGNCILDPEHPLYGDSHPRFGAPGGVNDVAELAEFLRVLRDIGYLSEGITRTVAFEVKPMPGESPQIVIANAKRTLRAAWRQV
ncbi:MAG: sugar phosphate isomerase/epimerase [Clostridia bacterium]|nr:xylose isomerase [Bacillota bacterium]MBO2521362.1 xylose isomerase [Bacillota bacterium]